jgi:ferritin-like protein
MATKKKDAQVDGFETQDYQGLDSFLCTRPKCGFQTFDAQAAADHAKEHATEDEAADVLADTMEHLAERAQVTTEVPDGQS